MWQIIIGGTERARKEWDSGRTYTRRSNAMRRVKQIREARDMGIVTIWVRRMEEHDEGS